MRMLGSWEETMGSGGRCQAIPYPKGKYMDNYPQGGPVVDTPNGKWHA